MYQLDNFVDLSHEKHGNLHIYKLRQSKTEDEKTKLLRDKIFGIEQIEVYNKPIILLTSGLTIDDSPGIFAIEGFVNQLLQDFVTDRKAGKKFLEKYDVMMIPILNEESFSIVRFGGLFPET